MPGKLTIIGGGVRSGKSALAVRLAVARGGGAYIATAEGLDDEMRDRIATHRLERGEILATIEEPRDVESALAAAGDAPVVVVDCLTLWVSNLLLAGVASSAIATRIDSLAHAVDERRGETIIVTNEVGMGVVPSSRLGRTFRDVTGRAHQRLARRADELYVGIMGLVLRVVPGPVTAILPGDIS